MCLSVREHISETAEPIFTNFLCRSSVVVARSSSGGVAMSCTSGFMDDVAFGRNGPYGDAWKAKPLTYSGVAIPGQSLMSMSALFCTGMR